MIRNPPTEPFSVRLEVRSYEIDPQLHLNGGFYVQYADHSRFACVRAAGAGFRWPDLFPRVRDLDAARMQSRDRHSR